MESLDLIEEHPKKVDLTFPFLNKLCKEVARTNDSPCMPDFFLLDNDMKFELCQVDASRPKNDLSLKIEDSRSAVNVVLAEKNVNKNQLPRSGCMVFFR